MPRIVFRHSALLLLLTVVAACQDGTDPSHREGLPNKSSVVGTDASELSVVLVGAGDIAACTYERDELTAQILDTIPGTVFAVGDNAYSDGTADEYANCYAPTWGRHKDRTRPAPGNHDYRTADGAPYYEYFAANAGPPGLGYYSYDLGAWHIVSLNSNIDMTEGSPQESWLRADLRGRVDQCVLAYWHHPRFSSGEHGDAWETAPLMRALYDAGAEIVLSGHDHDYERFAPQNPGGVRDEAWGIRQFVVGTGGTGLRGFPTIRLNSEARNSQAHGVLKLTLTPGSYDWMFIPIQGQSYTDAGSGTCHGARVLEPGTIEVRVSASADDAEELATGSMALASSDLELVFDGGGDQLVGMRFTDIAIPHGALITNAYVQFHTDEANTPATALTVAGEAIDDARSFTSTTRNISSRPRTTAAVSWAPPGWPIVGEAGPPQRTPDLAAVLQEIVNRPGWESGNALALIISGTGERVAAAYNRDPAIAPLLHAEFMVGPPVDAGLSTISTNVATLPADGTSGAIITVTLRDADNLPIAGHRVTLTQNGSSVISASDPSDENGQVSFTVTSTTAGAVTYSATDATGVVITQTTRVTFEPPPPPPPPPPLPSHTGVLEVRIAAGVDDAEEFATGSVDLGSSDIELVSDAGVDQTVGLRFNGIAIARDAVITSAYVQFQTDETASAPGALTVAGEAEDNAPAFKNESGNISSRLRTSAAVPWAPPTWSVVGHAGPDQRTPSLAAVLQEIVNRPGWASGNSLVLIITGTGRRVAEAYNGVASAAPLLRVEFGPAATGPTVNADLSTVATNITSVPADGTTRATITVTLRDGSGAPVVGHAVSLAETGSSVISGPSGLSDANGQVRFTVTSTTVQDVRYTATDATDLVAITQTAQVAFAPLPTNATRSTVTTNIATLPADATSGATITVTLRDVFGAPVTGHNVSLAQTGSSVISAPSGPSDATGQVRFTVTNATAEAVTYTARDVTDGVTVSQTARVTFEALPPPPPPPPPPPSETGVLDVRIGASADDAEEFATGDMYRTSVDLELVFDGGGNQTVGLRFLGIAIPRGAVITNAYVQFQTDEATTVATALTIAGEATDNAATFSTAIGNISSRPRTSAAVPWAPPGWPTVGEAGSAQRTPNLAAVLQEIVSRPGWVSGNALALIVTGTGERVAAGYNAIPAAAPLLHVEFTQ